jgi:hypothetical protein
MNNFKLLYSLDIPYKSLNYTKFKMTIPNLRSFHLLSTFYTTNILELFKNELSSQKCQECPDFIVNKGIKL